MARIERVTTRGIVPGDLLQIRAGRLCCVLASAPYENDVGMSAEVLQARGFWDAYGAVEWTVVGLSRHTVTP